MRLTRFLIAAWAAALPLMTAAQQLTVSAAASLSNVFNELAPRFEADRPGVTLRLNLAASGVLIGQVAHGAPVDVLASADQATVRRGIAQKLLDADSKHDFAYNTVVLVVPASGGPDVRTLADLGEPRVKRVAMGKVATVPAGRYTQEALESAGLWHLLQSRLVHADSVRQVLDYVARGEVDAGFVYRTDALIAADKVRVVRVAGGHTPVRYPAIVVSDSRNKALARDFIAFLATPAAQAVLAKQGFGKP